MKAFIQRHTSHLINEIKAFTTNTFTHHGLVLLRTVGDLCDYFLEMSVPPDPHIWTVKASGQYGEVWNNSNATKMKENY